jgi:hypothetical protein
MRRRTLAIAVCATTALISVPSAADSATLTYAAPSECPPRGELVRAIQRRISGRNSALNADDPPLELRIDDSDELFIGTVRVGADPPRRLAGNSCAEVVRAAAIVMASRIVKQREAIEVGAELPRWPAVADWASDASAPTTEAPSATDRETSTERRSARQELSVSPVALEGVLWTIGAGATSRFAIAPRVAWGPFVEGELVGSIWRVQLGVERVATGTFDAPPSQAAVSLSTLRPSACLHLPSRSVEPRACLGFDFAWFEAEGIASGSIVAGDRVSKPWFGAGPSVGVRFRLPVPLELDLAAGVQVPFQRGHLVFETPRIPVHTTGAVLPGVSLSLRALFERSKPRAPGIAR